MTNISYEQLIREHDEIDAIARLVEKEIARTDPDIASVAAILSSLSLAVGEHIQCEDRAVYQRLASLSDQKRLKDPIDFEVKFAELQEDWRTYLADWFSPTTIAEDWTTFVQETSEMMLRLRTRVRNETDLIYPLALQHGVITLRA